MKRFFLLTVFAFCAFWATAQESGPLDAFAANLASGEVSFKYSFEVKGDIPMKGNGTAALNGDSANPSADLPITSFFWYCLNFFSCTPLMS